jgi:deoxyribonuclease V
MNSNHKSKLRNILNRISKKVEIQDAFPNPPKNILGIDTAYSGNTGFTAGILLSWPDLDLLEKFGNINKIYFPYIPTLLSFREGPIIMKLLNKISQKPDIIMINSHGIAHPQFCGCASYVGVLTNSATIGIAKRKLCGEVDSSKEESYFGNLFFENKLVGGILNLGNKSREIVISPGHKITLKTALEVTIKSLNQGRFPIPIELAHQEAKKMRDKSETL